MTDESDKSVSDSFLDFAWSNQECLRGLTPKSAGAVIERLARDGMTPQGLFARVVSYRDADTLFDAVYVAVEKDGVKRQQLLGAIINAPASIWFDDTLNAGSVAERFNRAEDFEYLLSHHRGMLIHGGEESPFISGLSSDAYWLNRVRWYIAKCDWRRAWDELRKAKRGFFYGSRENAPRFGRIDSNWYCHAASLETVDTLTNELFTAVFGNPDVATPESVMTLELTAHFRQVRNAQRRKKLEGRVARPTS